jgi:hypothetical protein
VVSVEMKVSHSSLEVSGGPVHSTPPPVEQYCFLLGEFRAASKVAVLGRTPVDNLFGGAGIEYNPDPTCKFVNE